MQNMILWFRFWLSWSLPGASYHSTPHGTATPVHSRHPHKSDVIGTAEMNQTPCHVAHRASSSGYLVLVLSLAIQEVLNRAASVNFVAKDDRTVHRVLLQDVH